MSDKDANQVVAVGRLPHAPCLMPHAPCPMPVASLPVAAAAAAAAVVAASFSSQAKWQK